MRNMTVFAAPTVKEVAARWRAQYYDKEFGWGKICSGSSETIYRAILKAKSIKAIEKAVDGESWTQLFCVVCHEYRRKGIVFDNYDHPAEVCSECLEHAVKLMTTR